MKYLHAHIFDYNLYYLAFSNRLADNFAFPVFESNEGRAQIFFVNEGRTQIFFVNLEKCKQRYIFLNSKSKNIYNLLLLAARNIISRQSFFHNRLKDFQLLFTTDANLVSL